MKVKTGKSTKTAKANISLNILKNKIQPNTYFFKIIEPVTFDDDESQGTLNDTETKGPVMLLTGMKSLLWIMKYPI